MIAKSDKHGCGARRREDVSKHLGAAAVNGLLPLTTSVARKCCGQSSKRSSRGCRRGSRNCHATGEAIVKGKGVTSRDVTKVANPVDEV